MKQLTIISGKGGTGKTTIASSFAALAKDIVIADCDVDAPDLHLVLHPDIYNREWFSGAKVAVKDEDRCTECSQCEENCCFGAISNLEIGPLLCEGCGVCAYVCPEGAITLRDEPTGEIYFSETKHGCMVHAQLNMGSEGSGKLVTQVRTGAKKLCGQKDCDLIIIDGSPGIGCPVIASLAGVDLALVVTEPTLSGLSDLRRIVGVTEHFDIKTLVCVNKYDINVNNTELVGEFCEKKNLEMVGLVPFDEEVIRSVSLGKPLVDVADGPGSKAITELFNKVSGCI